MRQTANAWVVVFVTVVGGGAVEAAPSTLSFVGGAARTCTTCKAPVHSWDTLPVSFHSARTDTGPDGLWTAEDIETIKKFPLVTVRSRLKLHNWARTCEPTAACDADCIIAAA
jgi:hypothetical protein